MLWMWEQAKYEGCFQLLAEKIISQELLWPLFHFIDFLKTCIIEKISKTKAVQLLSFRSSRCYLSYWVFVEEGRLVTCAEYLNCGDCDIAQEAYKAALIVLVLLSTCAPEPRMCARCPQLDKLHPFWMSARDSQYDFFSVVSCFFF